MTSTETLAPPSLTEQAEMTCPGPNLVLFDGVCALCHRLVRFLIRRDRGGRICFAPLEGPTAQRLAERYAFPEDLDTVVYVQGFGTSAERVLYRSDAALAAVGDLGGAWTAVLVGRLVPRRLRDWLYEQVARRRYRWFGRYDVCPMPSAEDRARFLP